MKQRVLMAAAMGMLAMGGVSYGDRRAERSAFAVPAAYAMLRRAVTV